MYSVTSLAQTISTNAFSGFGPVGAPTASRLHAARCMAPKANMRGSVGRQHIEEARDIAFAEWEHLWQVAENDLRISIQAAERARTAIRLSMESQRVAERELVRSSIQAAERARTEIQTAMETQRRAERELESALAAIGALRVAHAGEAPPLAAAGASPQLGEPMRLIPAPKASSRDSTPLPVDANTQGICNECGANIDEHGATDESSDSETLVPAPAQPKMTSGAAASSFGQPSTPPMKKTKIEETTSTPSMNFQ